jgi:hypothetical protein
LQPTQIFDIGSFLASLSDKIINDKGFKALSDAIVELQEVLNETPLTKIIFKGHSFYNNQQSIPHYETTGSNYTQIANIAVLFPINKINSDLLNCIFDENNYGRSAAENSQDIPTFLTSSSYAKVINKIHNLPPMGM